MIIIIVLSSHIIEIYTYIHNYKEDYTDIDPISKTQTLKVKLLMITTGLSKEKHW